MATPTKSNRGATPVKRAKRSSGSRRLSQVSTKPVAESGQARTQRVGEFNQKVAERMAEVSERTAEGGKRAAAAYLSSCEKAILSAANSYEKTAGSSKLDWVSGLATAQADFARAATKAYGRAVRQLVS